MRPALPLLCCAIACAHGPPTEEELAVHRGALVVDTHSDVTDPVRYDSYDLGLRHDFNHEDLPRMREGGLKAEFFSIFVQPERFRPDQFFDEAQLQIEAVQKAVGAYPAQIALARTAKEVRDNAQQGRISALLGVEGGHMLLPGTEDEQLDHLRVFAFQGVRYMTLTWANSNAIGGSSGDEGESKGITPFGRRVVAEMESLGVLVDLSHVSDPLFWDAIHAAKKPVLVSHSSSRSLTNHPRNLTDAQLKAVALNGETVCINFSRGFIDDNYRLAAVRVANQTRNLKNTDRRKAFAAAGLPDVPVAKLIDHIEHVAKVAGVDHTCLGSDFDGVPMLPNGLEDVSKLPVITAELLRRGFSKGDVEKILGLNVLRVLEAAEVPARQR
jgi:membrane dipeptidase